MQHVYILRLSVLRFKFLQAAHSRMFYLIHYVKIKTLMTLTVELSIRVAWQNVIVLIWSSNTIKL